MKNGTIVAAILLYATSVGAQETLCPPQVDHLVLTDNEAKLCVVGGADWVEVESETIMGTTRLAPPQAEGSPPNGTIWVPALKGPFVDGTTFTIRFPSPTPADPNGPCGTGESRIRSCNEAGCSVWGVPPQGSTFPACIPTSNPVP